MKRVVEVALEDQSLTVTYDRDALFPPPPKKYPEPFLGNRTFDETMASFEALAASLVSWDLLRRRPALSG